MSKRKPLPPPLLPGRVPEETARPVPKPPLPARRNTMAYEPREEGRGDELLVVEAPHDSNPTSPAHAEFAEQMEMDAVEAESPPEETSSRSNDNELLSPGFERTSTSPEDGPKLPSWVSAEEEEARSRSVWVGEAETHHS
jgi:hypothetical protein